MHKHITHQGQPVHYDVYNDAGSQALPVVLLHGLCEDNEIWSGHVTLLRDKYHLIIPDLPGSGRSPLPSATSMESMAAAVRTILYEEQVEECILVGHSMGGYVTLAFAALYPAAVRAIGLYHSSSYADTEEKKATRRKSIEFIRSNGTASYLKQATPNLFSEKFRQHHPETVSTVIGRYSSFHPNALIAYHEAMIQRRDRTKILETFPGPVLFIIGQHDNAVPLKDSLHQCHLPNLSYICILEDSGHMGMLEEPEKANKILEAFINH